MGISGKYQSEAKFNFFHTKIVRAHLSDSIRLNMKDTHNPLVELLFLLSYYTFTTLQHRIIALLSLDSRNVYGVASVPDVLVNISFPLHENLYNHHHRRRRLSHGNSEIHISESRKKPLLPCCASTNDKHTRCLKKFTHTN